ncbi:MAG: cyclodeaminase/cyclohydrolase family protein, partial [Acetobacterium sp.]|nr:cyclodeaminase/cyclohydrolase family protein [Acetobacterium sp.]
MYKISELTVADYLAKMSVCDFPGPAAGSAAATAAAMAAALLEMSCDGSLRKNGENPLLAESIAIGTAVRQACLILADTDMTAYGQVIVAAKNKATDWEAYETAMKGATEPFIQILRHCHRLLVQIEKVIKGSFSRVLGDLVGGAYLAEAAAVASKSGIDVNLMLIHDAEFKTRYQTEAQTLYQACTEIKAAILAQVFKTPVRSIHTDSQAVLEFWFAPQNQPFWFQK